MLSGLYSININELHFSITIMTFTNLGRVNPPWSTDSSLDVERFNGAPSELLEMFIDSSKASSKTELYK